MSAEIITPPRRAARAAKPARGLRLVARLLWYEAIYRRFRQRTMIGRDAYLANLYLADRCLSHAAAGGGCVVECGTWRGGMAAGLATLGGPARDYYFFDTFAGLP